jgi:hypothetical protein
MCRLPTHQAAHCIDNERNQENTVITTPLRVTAHDTPLWTIYDHPADYPDMFVARLWHLITGEPVEGAPVLTASTLDQLRGDVQHATDFVLCCIPRQPEDDPVIVESWL